MSDTRSAMRDRFAAILDEQLAKIPESMFVNVPVGKLVDAAHEVFADVPRIPAYDPETSPRREFHGVISREDATEGRVNDRVRAEPSETDYGVWLTLLDGRTGTEVRVLLPARDAEEFFLNGLSLVAHQRNEEKREATGA